MKNIKSFETFNEGLLIPADVIVAAPFLKVLYNSLRRKFILKGIKENDIEKLDSLIRMDKNKNFEGEIVDNNDSSKLKYNFFTFQNARKIKNIISLDLDKIQNKLTLTWNVERILLSNQSQSITIDLNEEEKDRVEEIIDSLKTEKYNSEENIED